MLLVPWAHPTVLVPGTILVLILFIIPAVRVTIFFSISH